jgi:hypothetical protein
MADCKAAAVANNLFNYDQTVSDDNQNSGRYIYDPKGCYYEAGRVYDSSTGLYVTTRSLKFNSKMTNRGSCSTTAWCLCAPEECQTCKQGYYSPGGNNVACTKCPLDKPYTGDGKSTTIGATSISSCKMLTCNPGFGLPSDYSTPVCSTCMQGFYSSGGIGATCTK